MILSTLGVLAIVLFVWMVLNKPIAPWETSRGCALLMAIWSTFIVAAGAFGVITGRDRAGDAPLLYVFYGIFAGLGWFIVMKASDPEYRPVLWSGFRWAVLVGAPAFIAGSYGPILFSWGGPLGPLHGLLTGPLGALAGAAFGTWRAWPAYREAKLDVE